MLPVGFPGKKDSEMEICVPEVIGGCLLWGSKGSRIRQREKLNCNEITTKDSGDRKENSGTKIGLEELSFIKTRCSGRSNPSITSH